MTASEAVGDFRTPQVILIIASIFTSFFIIPDASVQLVAAQTIPYVATEMETTLVTDTLSSLTPGK